MSDLSLVVDEDVKPSDLPADATAKDCRKKQENFDRTKPVTAYGYYLCRTLAAGATPWKTLTNAESYMFFAKIVAMSRLGWDFRAGFATPLESSQLKDLINAFK